MLIKIQSAGFPCSPKAEGSYDIFISWNGEKWRISPTFQKFVVGPLQIYEKPTWILNFSNILKLGLKTISYKKMAPFSSSLSCLFSSVLWRLGNVSEDKIQEKRRRSNVLPEKKSAYFCHHCPVLLRPRGVARNSWVT